MADQPTDPQAPGPKLVAPATILIALDAQGHVGVKSTISDRHLFLEVLLKAVEAFGSDLIDRLEAKEEEQPRVIPFAGLIPPFPGGGRGGPV
jgi:hypothetical protein